jgi:ectoine hydroxylase-related dioxygenase (phytanoyl-CoA dioxygenase family)
MSVDRDRGKRTNVVAVLNERHDFSVDGVEIRRAVLTLEEMNDIKAEVSVDHEILRRTGIRNLEKKFSSIARVAASPPVLSVAASLLGKAPLLVRALFFDKTPQRNWFVAWHQDRTVALNRRVEIAKWGPWTRKDGIHHVQPTRGVLDQMVTIRLHIDETDAESGCLHVIPGSHRMGILRREEIGREVARSVPLACAIAAGDAVAMHPLILHSSEKSRRSTHRRVVHLEYSSYELPFGVSWA